MITVELTDGRVVKLPPPVIEGEHGNIGTIDPNSPESDPFHPDNRTVQAPEGEVPPKLVEDDVLATVASAREATHQSVDLYPAGSAAYEKGGFSEAGQVPGKWQYCIVDGFDNYPTDKVETFRSIAKIAGITFHPDPEQNRVIIKKFHKTKALVIQKKTFMIS